MSYSRSFFIVCKECRKQINEETIKKHYWGMFFSLVEMIISIKNELSLFLIKSNTPTQRENVRRAIIAEDKLLKKANKAKIPCPHGCKNAVWIKTTYEYGFID